MCERNQICFVAPYAYPCLDPDSQVEHIGGAELQQVFIGKALRDEGYDVAYVTIDFGSQQAEVIDGLKIYVFV